MKKILIVLILILSLFHSQKTYASDLNALQRIKNLIEWHKNSRIQPIIYGYYLVEDWRFFIGVKIKI